MPICANPGTYELFLSFFVLCGLTPSRLSLWNNSIPFFICCLLIVGAQQLQKQHILTYSEENLIVICCLIKDMLSKSLNRQQQEGTL